MSVSTSSPAPPDRGGEHLAEAAPAAGDRALWVGGGLVAGAVAAALAGAVLIAEEPVPGIAVPGPIVEFGLPVVRVLLDVAAVAVIGLSLLPKLLGFDDPARTEPVARRARAAAVTAAWAWAGCAFVTVVFQAAELNPGTVPTPASVAAYVSDVGAGQGLVISGATALACAAVGLLAVRFGESVPAELRIGVALFGLLPIPVTGHAVDSVWHDPIMISMELHVMGSAAWTGGLLAIAVLLAARRDLLAAVLPRFSRLATLCLVLVSVSGLVTGLSTMALTPGVELPGAILTSDYGLLLLAKIALVALLVPLAAHIRFRLLPHVAARRATAFAAWAGTEIAVMGLAYGVAVTLTRASIG
ncbi:putative copper resistance protein D [Thermocatellispora tengchongensis]|uniref:Putative copper resistance protein D n=1 Tax=Thermocatellispora tengchongensis TaxID=1073253 RepID=A0A840P6L9_9ACTN|nr:CopD family protein [Thermocatellispora tengchongensis]MBB5135318.1 putative copper resistance protein D [Thermocatellispora tengchongensis]